MSGDEKQVTSLKGRHRVWEEMFLWQKQKQDQTVALF